MSTITAVENISLDGVMQAPGSPEEDTRGGFEHGGWALPYNDEVSMRIASQGMAGDSAMLLGRRTYESLMAAWGGRTDNPFSAVLEARHKYVASTTLTEPLQWANSTLLGSEGVAELKHTAPEQEIVLLGSGVLLRSLLAAGLVDRLHLSIHPLVLGTGTRLFDAEGAKLPLSLTESVTTTTGVIIATYHSVTS